MGTTGLTPGGKLRDKLLFDIGTHRVMHDRLQIIIQHPTDCPGKGSPLDQRKTFHRFEQALEKLDQCGVELSEPQRVDVTYVGQQVARTSR